jgi:hypothetical protein
LGNGLYQWSPAKKLIEEFYEAHLNSLRQIVEEHDFVVESEEK